MTVKFIVQLGMPHQAIYLGPIYFDDVPKYSYKLIGTVKKIFFTALWSDLKEMID